MSSSDLYVDKQLREFLNQYYAAVDTEGAYDTYAACFSTDAALVTPDRSKIVRREGILSS